MDVKSAFLNGVLKEEVYVAQPPSYEVEGQEDKAYRLRKVLYALNQAPRAWYSRVDDYLLHNGFDKCDDEPTLYIKESNGKILIVVLYVDDFIFTSNDDFLIVDFKEVMKSEFEMTELGLLRKLTPTPTVMGLKLSKEDCSSNVNLTLYKSMIGNLMYFTATVPNTMYVVSLVSRFMEIPKETHWQVAKRILRYVNGTKQYGILYTATNDFRLVGYTGSDWAESVDDRKSTSEYVFRLGFGAISWASKKQPIVSLSIAKAKYVATTVTMCQAVFMRRMLSDFHHDQEGTATIFCDNTSAILFSKNFVFHKRTKHINSKYYLIRELINNGEIVL
eukprot:PITA_23959